ncbi:MAG: cysteine desulfurase [Caulobacteraceae bacterium]|nr:cysteine desulfurase [Caulobacteraceae bacterium]
MTKVYLDYNATAPVRPEARDAAMSAMLLGGNPSSVHAGGRTARAMVEQARAQVAALVDVKPGSITFFSGGTEANITAIASAFFAGARRPVVLLTEHDSVMQTALASGLPVEGWPVDARGVADLDWLRERLVGWDRETDGPPLVCLSLANNETGVIQPVAEVAEMVRAADGWLHVDAVQAAGKIAVDFNGLGADTMALSGHKLGAPQGVGALATGPRVALTRRTFGGGQEKGVRAGTENVPGIVGFGAAAQAALRDLPKLADQAAWRDAAEARLKAEGVTVFGEGAPRLPQTLNFGRDGFGSELQVMASDLAGVMVSAGAACSSGKVARSHVLQAMGAGDLADCALRVSGGWASKAEHWDRFVDAWLEADARQSSRRREVA